MSNKSIKCGVSSCKYNDRSLYCNLDSITVGSEPPLAHDKYETECESFECS